MNRLPLSFLVLLSFVFVTTPSSAIDYYVCDCATGADPNCMVGNDASNGTSAATAWQSMTNVNSIVNTLQGGDRILFAKGGSWIDASIGNVYNFNTTGANPITFDSYNPNWGGTAKPILTEARAGINLFKFTDGGNADHDEGYIVQNLDLRGGGTGKWGVFAYNDADYIVLNSLDISGFEIGVHNAGANTANPGADQQNQNMTINNCTIMNCSAQGFLGGGDELLIENCYFENNGFATAIFNHNIYFSHGDNAIIRNNELYHATIVGGLADGVSLVVHGHHDNVLIEGNYVHEDLGQVTGNAWGIAVDPGYASAEYFTNLIIRNNLVVNMYNVGIGVASAPGALIENNVIINEASAGIRAIAAPDRTRGVEDMTMSDVTVRNNSIYLRGTDVLTTGIAVGGEGTGHVVVSNVVSMDNGNGFAFDLADGDYAAVNNNMMEQLGSATWGTGITLAAWQSSRGFDLNSLTGNPVFASTASPNYNLVPMVGSPLIDAGHSTLSATADYTSASRVGISDIGAYEAPTNPTGIRADVKSEAIIAYPNPAKDKLTIQLADRNSSVSMYDATGKLVYEANATGLQIMSIQTAFMSRGIYLLVVQLNSGNVRKKIVLN